MKRLAAILSGVFLTFAPLTVIYAPAAAATTNLIPNPSVEQSTNNLPDGWATAKTGSNTTTFNYLSSGHTGSHSLQVQMTKRSSGNAKWYFTPITVTPNTNYTFTDWYQSNVQTHIQAVITTKTGTTTTLSRVNEPASRAWKQSTVSIKTPANAKSLTIYHYLNAKGQLTIDDFGLDGPAPVAPTVSIASPATGSIISNGTQAITANATDPRGVASVQFKLNGSNLGGLITTAPYTYSWNTSSVANGPYTLSATATNIVGLTTTSPSVTVTVQNPVVPPPVPTPGNIIPNPSLDITTNKTSPDSWLSSNWGTNTAIFSYLNSGHSGGHSVRVDVSGYSNGAANWYYADVPVTVGKTYKYENWYQSNVDTEVDAEVTMSDGTVQYFWIGTVFANTNWTKFSSTFTVPAGAKSMALYQILARNGYIVSDDYSLSEYTPLPFNRGLVSIAFDDGWTNQYTNAFPLLQSYGLPATFYIISGELTDQPDYMTAAQVKNLQDSGNEIGSHTITHPDLTTVSQTQLVNEMSQSQATLQGVIGVAITDFAYPYGAYNLSTIAVGKQYYQSQRSVNGGFNTKDNLDLTQLKIYEVVSNISQAQVQGWVQGAISQKAWLILVFHEIAVTPTDPTDALYDTQPSDLNAELSYIKNSGVGVVTVHQAINEVLPQL